MDVFGIFSVISVTICIIIASMFLRNNKSIKKRKEEIKNELEKKTPSDIIDNYLSDDTKNDIKRIKTESDERFEDIFNKHKNRKRRNK